MTHTPHPGPGGAGRWADRFGPNWADCDSSKNTIYTMLFALCLTLTLLLLPTVKATLEFPASNRLVLEEQSPKKSSSPDHIFDTCRPLGRKNNWRDVTAVHADKATLGEFSLECHGIKVLDETDPESGKRRFDGERVINAFTKMESTSRDEDAIRVQREVGGENLKDLKAGKCPNKMAIWKKVKALLKENVPKCWRKKGYHSLSNDYDGACETQQTEESCIGGCQWNPIEEIWLIHETKFAKYGSYTNKLLKGNLWKDNSLKEEINGHSVFYRLGGLTREDMTTILNPEEVDGYDEDIMWVKRELVKDKTVDEKAHRGMVEAVLRNKIINHHHLDHRTQMLTNQLCGTEDDQDHVTGFPGKSSVKGCTPVYRLIHFGCSLRCLCFSVCFSLFSHCSLIVLSLFSHCSLIVLSLFSHCSLIEKCFTTTSLWMA
jgi:hypothetical protein